MATCFHLVSDGSAVLFGLYLWIRQCSYSWSRKNIIFKYLLVVFFIQSFQIAEGTFLCFLHQRICHRPMNIAHNNNNNNNNNNNISTHIRHKRYLLGQRLPTFGNLLFFFIHQMTNTHVFENFNKLYLATSPSFPFPKSKFMTLVFLRVVSRNTYGRIYRIHVGIVHLPKKELGLSVCNFSFIAIVVCVCIMLCVFLCFFLSTDQTDAYSEVTELKGPDNTTIGKGSTSKVYRGRYRKQDVAIKCLLRLDKRDEMGWIDLTLIFRESILSSSLSHPNIVKFIGASLTLEGFYLVYEYCVYGDLQQILSKTSTKIPFPNCERSDNVCCF
ncbi:hypothetical protein RFI_27124 [Reticulomyxa filosa]|uniref:Protein kinase domain-containing protein n=1 Tax=Reticulomyxa filosa TaxID=46433 RepID=X6M8D4_RETFI|nr:hypothetical protein RFI_27124 [Reticulomyxa filosa]|eukprot:ETO10253.1 hypothetical protein RFI_27124 [Reticulomyxa filosa]